MIDCRYRHPGCCRVTSLTDIAGVDMGWAFRRSRATAMTTKAVIDDARMTKDNTNQPTIRHMTSIAFLSGYRMRWSLTGRENAVVAA